MANIRQLDALIDRLHSRTLAGQVRWESHLGPSVYQARFGDFVVVLQGSANALMPDNVSLDVKRLSGAVVAQITTGPYSLLGRSPISDTAKVNLINLYRIVDNKTDDLTELLNLI